jgi:hypothetical protein
MLGTAGGEFAELVLVRLKLNRACTGSVCLLELTQVCTRRL